MELAIELGMGAFLLLIVGSLVIGIGAQVIGETGTDMEWLVTAIVAFVGGLVASEFIVAFRDFGPVWDGLALVPALVGALVFGAVADAVTRYVTGGTYTHHPVGA